MLMPFIMFSRLLIISSLFLFVVAHVAHADTSRLAILTSLSSACIKAGKNASLHEQCRVLDTISEETRLGAYAAVEGRDVVVLTRAEVELIVKKRRKTVPCGQGPESFNTQKVRDRKDGLRRSKVQMWTEDTVSENLFSCNSETAKRSGVHNILLSALTLDLDGWSVLLELHGRGVLLSSKKLKSKTHSELKSDLRIAAEALVREGLDLKPRADDPLRPTEAKLVTFDSPRGAIVHVDGRLRCNRTPCAMRLAPGRHQATFEKEGLPAATVAFTAEDGATVNAIFPSGQTRLAVLVPYAIECPQIPYNDKVDPTIPSCKFLEELSGNSVEAARTALKGRNAVVIYPDIRNARSEIDLLGPCKTGDNCDTASANKIGADYVLSAAASLTTSGMSFTFELREVHTGKILAKRKEATGIWKLKETAANWERVQGLVQKTIRAGLKFSPPVRYKRLNSKEASRDF